MELQKYKYNRITYYVDYRLQQFRSIPKNFGMIEFLDFDDVKGDRILAKMIRENVAKTELLNL